MDTVTIATLLNDDQAYARYWLTPRNERTWLKRLSRRRRTAESRPRPLVRPARASS